MGMSTISLYDLIEAFNVCMIMNNLYRGPSKDASYQVSIHLAKRFQRRRFKKISQSETKMAYGGHVC
jgi:hypothetical protein